MSNGKYRNWCFTAYKKPTEEICEQDTLQYICMQTETCPKTDREHYQGYMELSKQMRLSEVKKLMNDNTIHLEPRWGTQDQAVNYCKKLETAIKDSFCSWGDLKKQGNRSELDSIYDCVESGMTTKEILREHRGHALRSICAIEKALKAEHDCSAIDAYILKKRKNLNASVEMSQGNNASEVLGNTKPNTEYLDDIMVEESIDFSDGICKDDLEDNMWKSCDRVYKRDILGTLSKQPEGLFDPIGFPDGQLKMPETNITDSLKEDLDICKLRRINKSHGIKAIKELAKKNARKNKK